MRLEILNVKQSSGADTIVEGDTGLGIMSGIWRSKHRPAVGEEHDVELTLPDPTELRLIASPQDRKPGVTAVDQNHFRFRGECEAVHEDDVIIVRLATNWIEMVNSENFSCKVGDWVEFTVPIPQVEIYPIGG